MGGCEIAKKKREIEGRKEHQLAFGIWHLTEHKGLEEARLETEDCGLRAETFQYYTTVFRVQYQYKHRQHGTSLERDVQVQRKLPRYKGNTAEWGTWTGIASVLKV